MSHWFDEYAKGVAEGLPWAGVLRRVAQALRAEEAAAEESPRVSRRGVLAGLSGAAAVWLIETLTPPAAAEEARARRVAAKPCENHEDLKNGLRTAPVNDYFEGVGCTQLEAMKVAAAKYCDRFCKTGNCANKGDRCVPIAMGGTPAFKNECDLVNSGLSCKNNPGSKAYACRYSKITQCTCLCKAVA